jgi:hypothetical protein
MQLSKAGTSNVKIEAKYFDKPPKKKKTEPPETDIDIVSDFPDEWTAPKKWTIMYYNAADNNLLHHLEKNFDDMEQVGSTENMHLVTLFDRGEYDCKVHYITPDNEIDKINSPVIDYLGDTNTADPQVLADFISYSMEKFPAEHYALIISDHGGGWQGVVVDETSDDKMTAPQVREALSMAREKTGNKLDVIALDACFMSSAEFAYEIKDEADYMVGSQDIEINGGWNMTDIVSGSNDADLETGSKNGISLTPEEFAEKIVDDSTTNQEKVPTLSALDLTQMDKYGRATKEFARTLNETDTPGSIFKELAKKTEKFTFRNIRDQVHFCEMIAEHPEITDEKLKKASTDLAEVIKEDLVIANEHSSDYSNANGLTAGFPLMAVTRKSYKNLNFEQDTGWLEALKRKTVLIPFDEIKKEHKDK